MRARSDLGSCSLEAEARTIPEIGPILTPVPGPHGPPGPASSQGRPSQEARAYQADYAALLVTAGLYASMERISGPARAPMSAAPPVSSSWDTATGTIKPTEQVRHPYAAGCRVDQCPARGRDQVDQCGPAIVDCAAAMPSAKACSSPVLLA
jgi:hypothetical protein